MAIVDNQTVEESSQDGEQQQQQPQIQNVPQHQEQHGDQQTTEQEEQLQQFQTNQGQSCDDDDDRKIFIGGLTQDTSTTDISTHFSNYGKVTNVSLKLDAATGRSRGLAFVTFENVAECVAACAQQSHIIKGRLLIVGQPETHPDKIYVARLKLEFTEDDIKEHFEQFGTVTSVEQPFERMKCKKRNYCFVTFAKESTATNLIKQGTTLIQGQKCDIRKATSRPNQMQGGYDEAYGCGGGYGMGGGYDMVGYGMGGYGMGGYGMGGYGRGGGWGGAAQMQGRWQGQQSGMGGDMYCGRGYGSTRSGYNWNASGTSPGGKSVRGGFRCGRGSPGFGMAANMRNRMRPY